MPGFGTQRPHKKRFKPKKHEKVLLIIHTVQKQYIKNVAMANLQKSVITTLLVPLARKFPQIIG